MTEIFLSRSREANFHVSFYSRFSRIGRKVSLSPLDFQDLKKISLSPLDFQDFWDQFLFLLSIFKILEKISLSPLDFQDFLNEHFDNWSLSMICQNMLVSLYLTTFTFTLLPDWFLTLSWHCTVSDKDCRKGKFLPLGTDMCVGFRLIVSGCDGQKDGFREFSYKNFNNIFLLSRLDLSAFKMSLSTLVSGYIHLRILF